MYLLVTSLAALRSIHFCIKLVLGTPFHGSETFQFVNLKFGRSILCINVIMLFKMVYLQKKKKVLLLL
jgi:hypothetical protein